MPDSCADILAADPSAADGDYQLDPDGPGGDEPYTVRCDMTQFDGGWTRCLRVVNTNAEDLTTNDWLDACVDATMADWSGNELMITLAGPGGGLLYAAMGARSTDWTYDNLTSTAEPALQGDLADHEAAIPLSLDGTTNYSDILILPGRSGDDLGCLGGTGDGYAVLVLDDGAINQRYPKIMALPYRFQVGADQGQPRTFGSSGDSWTEAHEISYDGSTTWDICGTLPAQLGTLELYVR
ncbi:fibrinogen-like YCDxxxxGGGW domain-containing protein [Haliangium sp.]|uniref:fibrinogen-like YCDxxxxGGGW domain-containing protein n=1 Tax=Haliangium sp. TaxID=2663208 RepID=UPI003D13571C